MHGRCRGALSRAAPWRQLVEDVDDLTGMDPGRRRVDHKAGSHGAEHVEALIDCGGEVLLGAEHGEVEAAAALVKDALDGSGDELAVLEGGPEQVVGQRTHVAVAGKAGGDDLVQGARRVGHVLRILLGVLADELVQRCRVDQPAQVAAKHVQQLAGGRHGPANFRACCLPVLQEHAGASEQVQQLVDATTSAEPLEHQQPDEAGRVQAEALLVLLVQVRPEQPELDEQREPALEQSLVELRVAVADLLEDLCLGEHACVLACRERGRERSRQGDDAWVLGNGAGVAGDRGDERAQAFQNVTV